MSLYEHAFRRALYPAYEAARGRHTLLRHRASPQKSLSGSERSSMLSSVRERADLPARRGLP